MLTGHCSDHPVQMESDVFLNNPDKVKQYEDFGMTVDPVDFNNGFVPTEKFNKGNLKKVEKNIQDRFGL